MSVSLEVYPAAQKDTSSGSAGNSTVPGRARRATDDEILGLVPVLEAGNPEKAELDSEFARDGSSQAGDDVDAQGKDTLPKNFLTQDLPENLRTALQENPELRAAWQDVQAYRETFETPEAARQATALLADFDRMDALFFSHKPEDHAELARAVAALDPVAFASLARAIADLANNSQRAAAPKTDRHAEAVAPAEAGLNRNANREAESPAFRAQSPNEEAQVQFFHATNSAAVEGVLGAIESQVERLLPEGISKSARNRVVGEIYRELDATLRSNRQLATQMRDAFRSGALDADHQRAIVSLITNRARQALPGVAKRVLNEWTSTLVAANREQRLRQRSAERRVDIAGSGGSAKDGRRPVSPRDLDYSRLSDSDILNM